LASRLWTRPELLEVLKLYCLLPFGKLHNRNPQIIALASKLDRTPSAVALKMVNFASLDSTLEQRGMQNASSLDRTVWSEFFEAPDRFVGAEDAPQTAAFQEAPQAPYLPDGREGLDIVGVAKRRVNQGFFRSMILASYESRCAMTGIGDSKLLVAAHISTWASNAAQRMDPHNGICLNYLHDRAFEEGLIAVAPDYSILYSSRLAQQDLAKLRAVSKEKLTLPARFKPSPTLLEQHRQTRFIG